MRIGLDIDNTLYPFTEMYAQYAEEIHGLDRGTLDDVAYTWDWYKHQWGWTTQQFLDTYVEAVKRGMWLDGEPRPGALFMARKLVKRGHEIVYVTARHVSGSTESIPQHVVEHQTRFWLWANDFPHWDRIYITKDKHEIPTDVFLDDSVDVIKALVEHGHPAPVLLTREHNARFATPAGARRAADFRHFLEIVDATQLARLGSWDVA